MVELLAAVAVVGVLAVLALPRYRSHVARARMAEAKVNLATLQTLQKEYILSYDVPYFTGLEYGLDKCTDPDRSIKNELGFRLDDCSRSRYRYTSTAASDCATGDGSIPQGQIYPNCSADDEWQMDRELQLKHTINVVASCPDASASAPKSTCVAGALPSVPAVSPPTGVSPPVRRPPSICINTCPTGHTREADCSCTPPPTGVPPGGYSVAKPPISGTLPGGPSVTKPPAAPSCPDDANKCCYDKVEIKKPPPGLTCKSWKGKYNLSDKVTYGCCEKEPEPTCAESKCCFSCTCTMQGKIVGSCGAHVPHDGDPLNPLLGTDENPYTGPGKLSVNTSSSGLGELHVLTDLPAVACSCPTQCINKGDKLSDLEKKCANIRDNLWIGNTGSPIIKFQTPICTYCLRHGAGDAYYSGTLAASELTNWCASDEDYSGHGSRNCIGTNWCQESTQDCQHCNKIGTDGDCEEYAPSKVGCWGGYDVPITNYQIDSTSYTEASPGSCTIKLTAP